jgi:hypothetical protein
MTEHDEQTALFEWMQFNLSRYPELSLAFAIPSGAKLPYSRDVNGHRFCRQANILKAEGLKAGVPDIFLPVSRGVFHGFFIEMKYGKNTTSILQKSFIQRLRAQGYCVLVTNSWQSAAMEIENYLEGRL